MKKLFGLSAIAATAISFGGCASYMTVTPSVQGRAYAVRHTIGGSDFWNCDATSGDPVCYQVKSTSAAAAK